MSASAVSWHNLATGARPLLGDLRSLLPWLHLKTIPFFTQDLNSTELRRWYRLVSQWSVTPVQQVYWFSLPCLSISSCFYQQISPCILLTPFLPWTFCLAFCLLFGCVHSGLGKHSFVKIYCGFLPFKLVILFSEMTSGRIRAPKTMQNVFHSIKMRSILKSKLISYSTVYIQIPSKAQRTIWAVPENFILKWKVWLLWYKATVTGTMATVNTAVVMASQQQF